MSAGFAVSRRHFVWGLGSLGAALVSGTGASEATAGGGMSPSPANAARAVLERHVAQGYSPGMVALVGRGAQADVLAVGRQSLQSPDPMRRDSIFRIASMTKPITAAVAMMLTEEGKLHLDEPVERLLPELANRRVLKRLDGPLDDTVPARRPITVEDLLAFRCGMGLILERPDSYPIQRKIRELGIVGFGPPDPASPLHPDEWMKRLGTLPLMAQPGERWMYNTGSYILGVLLARAAGQPLPDLLRERLFDPLGMKDTAFWVPSQSRSRLVSAYVPTEHGIELYESAASSAWSKPPAFPDAAAGLVSTADDFFAFSRFMLDGGMAGGRRLLSQASVKTMATNRLTPAQRAGGTPILDAGRGWGLGMSVVVEKGTEGLPAGAFGWNGGLGTSWVADPQSGQSTLLLTNTMFASPVLPAVHQEFLRTVWVARS